MFLLLNYDCVSAEKDADMKKKLGTKTFCIVYNMLGLLGLNACVYGFVALCRSADLHFGDKDVAQIAVVIITVLFFTSSYLLLKKQRWGVLIPIFLLSFIITGGFVILLPLLISHIIFFSQPKIQKTFV